MTTGSTSTIRACKVGRIQNFRSWSPEMVPDPDKACYGLEYFCFEHDGLWDSTDEDLIELAKTRVDPNRSGQGRRCAWTAASSGRKRRIRFTMTITPRTSRRFARRLEERYPNLHLVGRNGMHKYNNQDHAMMTAMLCVENILADTQALRSLAGERRRRIPRSRRSRGRRNAGHRPAPGAESGARHPELASEQT